MKAGYEITDHGADVGIVVTGRNESELFSNAARALFSLLIEEEGIGGELARTFILSGDDTLVGFLNELLFLWDTERYIVHDVIIEREDKQIIVNTHGCRFDKRRHTAKGEVKAATYHGFTVSETAVGLEAKVVLDV